MVLNMPDIDLEQITVDPVDWSAFTEKKIAVDILRLDKIHFAITGNKWFKLRYYFEEAKRSNKRFIVTFGGAWSNHIAATAVCCQLSGLGSIGIIRGEKPASPLSLSGTLIQASIFKMHLHFVSREEYREKKIPFEITDEMYIVNEGGFGDLGMRGAATILDHCQKEKYTHICCAAGTGTMTAGLLTASDPDTKIISVSVMKPNPGIRKGVSELAESDTDKCDFIEDYHFGGYAKHKPELLHFMNEFYRKTNIPSDFVYTGKLFYAIADLASKKYFPPGSRLLLIHSGGLQGNSSLDKGTLIF